MDKQCQRKKFEIDNILFTFLPQIS